MKMTQKMAPKITVNIISIALATSLLGSFALAKSIPEARLATSLVAAETEGLVGNCENIAPTAAKIRFALSSIAAGLNEFAARPDGNIESALKNIDLGIDAVDMSLIECINYTNQGYSDSKILLDMYLLHIDIDLMIAQYGVGPDLKRQRN